MPNYKYSAIGSDGRTVRGSLGAGTQQELVEELRRRNLMPVLDSLIGKSKKLIDG